MDNQSKLSMYSLAYVAEDIVEDSPFIKAIPIEILTDLTGIVGADMKHHAKTADIDGNKIHTVVNKTHTITAKWINFNEPNRLTAPTVHMGETIMLWKYVGDRYFWTTFYNELDLRKREKATYVYSNKDDIKDASKLKQIYYWTVDTINKFVRLHTDDHDNEATTYDFELNTKDGIFILVDGLGNEIKLASIDGLLTITTNTSVVINTKHAVVNASADATINTPSLTVNSGITSINP